MIQAGSSARSHIHPLVRQLACGSVELQRRGGLHLTHHQNVFQGRAVAKNTLDFGVVFRIHNAQARATAIDTVFQGLLTKQHRRQAGHNTRLEAGDVRYRAFRALRQTDRDPVPTHNPQGRKQFRQSVGVLLQAAVGHLPHLPVGILECDGDALLLRRPAILDRIRDIEHVRYRP